MKDHGISHGYGAASVQIPSCSTILNVGTLKGQSQGTVTEQLRRIDGCEDSTRFDIDIEIHFLFVVRLGVFVKGSKDEVAESSELL